MITKNELQLISNNYDFTMKVLLLVSKDVAGHIFNHINFKISDQITEDSVICGRSYTNTIEILLLNIIKYFEEDWAIKQAIIHTCIHESFHLVIAKSPEYEMSDLESFVEKSTLDYIQTRILFLEKELDVDIRDSMRFHEIMTEALYNTESNLIPRITPENLWGTFFYFITKSDNQFFLLDNIESYKYNDVYIQIFKNDNCILEEPVKLKGVIQPISDEILAISHEDIELNQSVRMYYQIDDTDTTMLITLELNKILVSPLIRL